MRTAEHIVCRDFPCAGMVHGRFVLSMGDAVDAEAVRCVRIAEAPGLDPGDDFGVPGSPFFAERVIPDGVTYRMRGGVYELGGIRVLPARPRADRQPSGGLAPRVGAQPTGHVTRARRPVRRRCELLPLTIIANAHRVADHLAGSPII
jgi:hypothetical protein